jgi:DNA adenine methylase
MNFAVRAEQAKFICSDFREIMQSARVGDVIYADPPYFPLEDNAGFTDYTIGGFSLSDQADLADLAKLCAMRGIAVVISNHATNLARRMYKGAKIRSFDVQRYISCDGGNRSTARELLAIFEPTISTNDKANQTRLNALLDEGECLVENAAA